MATLGGDGPERSRSWSPRTRWLAVAVLGLGTMMSIAADSVLAADAPRLRDIKGEADHKDHKGEIEVGVQRGREVGTERRRTAPTGRSGRKATSDGRQEAAPTDSGKAKLP